MATRKAPAALLAVLLLPALARGQVSAPSPVQETEEAPAEQSAPRKPARPPRRGSVPAADPVEPASDRAAPPAPAAEPAAADVPVGTVVPPPPTPPAKPAERPAARAIEPVASSYGALLERWAERRAALREPDPARAAAAAEAILTIKRQLAIENLVAFAASEVRESSRALEANLPAQALLHAETAVKLAPDFADAHLAVARARAARTPGELLAALRSLGDALGAAAREPHTLRAFLGDLASAALAALFTAACATIALVALRRLRLFLHDLHHLPILRGSHAVQAAFLGLVILALPVAFGLGPFLVLATVLVASWLYLTNGERVVLSVALGVLVAMPWAVEAAAHFAAWTGSPAEVVYELEHGAPSDEEVAEIAGGAMDAPSAPLAAALGRNAKRRGDLAGALRWYGEALKTGEGAGAVLVNVGNVRFLQGELDEAKAQYLAAVDRSGGDLTTLAAAHYNLSKLYLRSSDIEKSSAARDRAEQEDGSFLRRHGSDDDFSANRYLVDVPVSLARITALATLDPGSPAVRDAVRSRIGGPLPRGAWPWGPLGLLAVLWVMAALERRIEPAHTCDKCGRPACRRCDGAAGPLCGQCVNVYVKKGVVEARDRLRKEAQVRRYRRFQVVMARALVLVGGGAGHVFQGLAGRGFAVLTGLLFAAFLVWFWRGLMPPPQPSPHVLAGKLLVAVPLGLTLYLLAVRDVFRRSGS